MRDKLIELLESTGYPAFLQGSFVDDEEYPETLFTFWQFQGDGVYYDNVPASYDLGYWVYCYSSDPIKIETLMRTVEQSLRSSGFIPQGSAIDVKSDNSSHTGKMLTVYYKEVI